MVRFHPPSIEDQGGLRPFLDARIAQHGGAGYALFAILYKDGFSAWQIAKAFRNPQTGKPKSPKAVQKWIDTHEKEQGIRR